MVMMVVESAKIWSRTSLSVRMLLWEQVVGSVNQQHLEVLGERRGVVCVQQTEDNNPYCLPLVN